MRSFIGKLFFFVVLSAFGRTQLNAQYIKTDSLKHVYKVNYWVSGGIALAGGVSNYLGIPHIINKPEITVTEFQTLDRAQFGGFDRTALNQDPLKREMYNKDANILLITGVTMPVLLAFDKRIQKDWGKILVMYLETISIASNVYTYAYIGPSVQNKFRPIVYYDALTYAERNDGNNRNSFYSGHVASTAAATFFMAKVYTDYHPELGAKKYLIYTAAAIPPLLLGYFRVKGLRHFPTDVAVGFAVGALCGILIPEIHRIKLKNKDMSIGLASNGVATGIGLKWQPGSSK